MGEFLVLLLVGIVVGATLGGQPYDFRAVNGPLLAPGLGAQGGRAEDLPKIFGSAVQLDVA